MSIIPETIVAAPTVDYAAEVKGAIRSYISDSIYVTVTKYQTDQSEYLLTHVIIAYASQIHSGLSHDTYGGEREKPTEAAARQNWIIGINGSNFSYETKTPSG